MANPRYALLDLATGELTDLPEYIEPAQPGRLVDNGRALDNGRIHIRLATVQLHEYQPAPDESAAAAAQFFEKAHGRGIDK